MNELEVVKRYGYREARVKPGFIFPRKVFEGIEKDLVKQAGSVHDNHTVYLVESTVAGQGTHCIALYFHDFAVIIGNEEDIVIRK